MTTERDHEAGVWYEAVRKVRTLRILYRTLPGEHSPNVRQHATAGHMSKTSVLDLPAPLRSPKVDRKLGALPCPYLVGSW